MTNSQPVGGSECIIHSSQSRNTHSDSIYSQHPPSRSPTERLKQSEHVTHYTSKTFFFFAAFYIIHVKIIICYRFYYGFIHLHVIPILYESYGLFLYFIWSLTVTGHILLLYDEEQLEHSLEFFLLCSKRESY